MENVRMQLIIGSYMNTYMYIAYKVWRDVKYIHGCRIMIIIRYLKDHIFTI